MTIYGYARVSTQDQNLQLQLDALQHCNQIVTEKCSAVKHRPELEALLDRLATGDTLVVWRLDRLGRSMIHLCELISLLATKGVSFLSVSEQIDTTSATGKFVFHILSAAAEFERNLISERVKAGMRSAKAHGKILGAPIKQGKVSRATEYRRRKKR